MGLIKIAQSAIESTLQDQWKQAIRCEDLGNDILMKKVTTPSGVIPNKSTIIVAPGQCAVIFDNGRIIDATAEDGPYVFDESSTPSFLAGQFGETFKEMWQRFTYKGTTAKQQAVYFFNTKEIINNNYGTPAPIPFQDWSHGIPNQMTGTLTPMRVEVKCHGQYTFKISNPALFMSEIAGTADVYRKDQLIEQMRSEVVASFQNVLNELGNSEYKVPVLELPSKTEFIKGIMDEKVFDEPIRRRGISIVGFNVKSVTLDDESEKKIDAYELAANNHMQQGRLVDSYANAVQDAAKNANGAANGFMGIGMMNMASNGIIGGAATGPWQNTPNNNPAVAVSPANNQPTVVEPAEKQPAVVEPNEKEIVVAQTAENVNSEVQNSGWECPNCKKHADGNFCTNCGTKKPEQPKAKFCTNCGNKLDEDAKFCPECGTKVE